MRFLVFLTLAVLASPSMAFQLNDGSLKTCTVSTQYGQYIVPELAHVPLPYGSVGWASPAPPMGRPILAFDPNRLHTTRAQATIAYDFVFYHECAHVRFQGYPNMAQNELAANCEGLRAMRADGKIDAAGEAILGQYHANANVYANLFGSGAQFWNLTVACANSSPLVVPAIYQ